MKCCCRELLLGRSDYLFFLFLHQCRAFAETIAQVSELRTAHSTFALYFDLVHARGVQWENTFHTFAVTDAADGESFIEASGISANSAAISCCDLK